MLVAADTLTVAQALYEVHKIQQGARGNCGNRKERKEKKTACSIEANAGNGTGGSASDAV